MRNRFTHQTLCCRPFLCASDLSIMLEDRWSWAPPEALLGRLLANSSNTDLWLLATLAFSPTTKVPGVSAQVAALRTINV
ncbi:MAG: hypothetical protein ACYSUV_19585 [Planctomycetota bacterium]|jgi:hypothetical protein